MWLDLMERSSVMVGFEPERVIGLGKNVGFEGTNCQRHVQGITITR